MIKEEKITTKKDDKEYELIYDKTVLCPGKVDSINFNLKDGDIPLSFQFEFSDNGDKYTTKYWEDEIPGINLKYQLNRWDADSYVEISNPVEYKNYKIMFRNQSAENRNHRLFYFSLLKEK
jgi:hypothetical protein